MSPEAIIVVLILVGMLTALFFELFPPEITLIITLLLVWNAGIISVDEALAGFSNDGMITVGALFVVVKGVEKSGIVGRLARKVFGSKTSKRMGLLRMQLLVFFLSAFFNNTPLVAMMLPITRDWARSRGFAPSQFLIPLSYVTIVGGLLTIIGTSTNLVVQGLLSSAGKDEFGFFDPGAIGLILGVIMIIYLTTIGQLVLPENKGGMLRMVRDRTKELITEAEILDNFPLIGHPVENMLRHLGLGDNALLKIRRRCEVIGKVKRSKRADSGTGSEIADLRDSDYVYRTKDYWYASPSQAIDITPETKMPQEISASKPVMGDMEMGSIAKPAVGDEAETLAPAPVDSHAITSADISTPARSRDDTNISEIQIIVQDPQNQPRASTVPKNALVRVEQGDTTTLSYVDIFPVPEGEVIHTGDIMFFTQPQGILNLENKKFKQGLKIIDANVLDIAGFGTDLIELVISDSSPFLGMSVADGKFTAQYSVFVIAVRSRGEDSVTNVQEVRGSVLRPGDVVLVVGTEQAYRQLLESRDFYAVTRVGSVPPNATWWDYLSCIVFIVMLGLITSQTVPVVQAAFTAMAVMVLGGWVAPSEAIKAIDFKLLALIGSALGLAVAIQNSGLDGELAAVVKHSGLPPQAVIFLVFGLTVIITELVTNNAAAALSLPMALSIADNLGVSYKPFAMAVLVAASTSFATPIGYQTNTMVWGPGGYRFLDYTKIGLPVDITFTIVASLVIPLIWPFH